MIKFDVKCLTLISSFVSDVNLLPPPLLKVLMSRLLFHVNKSTVKMNMLFVIPYKAKLTKYCLAGSLSFNLVLERLYTV